MVPRFLHVSSLFQLLIDLFHECDNNCSLISTKIAIQKSKQQKKNRLISIWYFAKWAKFSFGMDTVAEGEASVEETMVVAHMCDTI